MNLRITNGSQLVGLGAKFRSQIIPNGSLLSVLISEGLHVEMYKGLIRYKAAFLEDLCFFVPDP